MSKKRDAQRDHLVSACVLGFASTVGSDENDERIVKIAFKAGWDASEKTRRPPVYYWAAGLLMGAVITHIQYIIRLI